LVPYLAEAYRGRHPEGPPLAELRLIEASTTLDEGRVAAYSEQTLAVWRVS
jgi:hypothetical protein